MTAPTPDPKPGQLIAEAIWAFRDALRPVADHAAEVMAELGRSIKKGGES